MEKFILFGVAAWISFFLSDGFRPVFSEKHYTYQKVDKSDNNTDKPQYVGLTYVIKDMDPH